MTNHSPRTSGMIRAAMFMAFAQELREAGPEVSAEQFSEAVSDAIDNFGIEPAAISSEFGVTRATISRWKSGEAVPIAYVRRQLFSWLSSSLEAQAGESENVVRIYEYARKM